MIHTIDNLPEEILLGQQREKGANSVLFDATAWQALYPTGAASVAPLAVSNGLRITYTRQGETTVYPEDAARLSLTDNILTWTPSDAVLDIAGQGTVVLHCKEGGVEKCSAMACTYVVPDHAAAEMPPEPLKDYIAKWGSVDITVEELAPGSPPTASIAQDVDGTHIVLGIAGSLSAPE